MISLSSNFIDDPATADNGLARASEAFRSRCGWRTALGCFLTSLAAFGSTACGSDEQPEPEKKLGCATQLDLQFRYSCAVRTDGSLWCWGLSDYPGNGKEGYAADMYLKPTAIEDLGSDVEYVSTGEDDTCVVKHDGTLWCWGKNEDGALGLGDTSPRLSPAQVSALGANVASVSLGAYESCAIDQQQALWCWGHGQTTPVRVPNLGAVRAVSPGRYHTCALAVDSTVWCWGRNIAGGLGAGPMGATTATPEQVSSLPPIAEIASSSGVVALGVDQTLWVWPGLLSDESHTTVEQLETPETKPEHVSIQKRNGYPCFVDTSGQVWCWNAIPSGVAPKPIAGLMDVVQIACGNDGVQAPLVSALQTDGKIVSWGGGFCGDGNMDECPSYELTEARLYCP